MSAMPRPACPSCQLLLHPVAEYWSRGLRYWSVLPHDRLRFEQICQDPQKGLGDGIFWCPSLRLAWGPGLAAPHPRDILGRFQSLGDNCEFGLVQRVAEAEPLDLLRFASFHAPAEDRLRLTIEALTAGFDGLGEPASIVCEASGDEQPRQYAVWEKRWNLLYHPDRTEAEITADALHSQQARVLPFRRRKLMEDLAEAHRIFVWKSNAPTKQSDARDLLAVLRHYGPNRLLWVRTATDNRPAGHVEDAGDGLLVGYVARFAPYDQASDADYESWLAVCMNALILTERLKR